MTERRLFYRKISYFGAIVVLIIPLGILSRPENRESPGGKLAQLRTEYNLSQAKLGDIDPASETMKLATLGLRPVAVVILWENAHEYKKREDFTNFAATLEQITKLQPNFVKVWDYQSHNMTYNIAAEFDDYRHRYFWVRKGLKFLISGTEYNRDNPLLLSRVGFFVYHKIGKSDERVQFRKMFREDDDLHEYMNERSGGWMARQRVMDSAQEDRDNWIVAYKWYLLAQSVVDTKDKPVQGVAPVLFHSDPTMMLINYAATLEKEGRFGDEARNAWKRAGQEMERYGAREIVGAYGQIFRLNDMERLQERVKDQSKELQALLPPNTLENMRQELMSKLTEEQRQAILAPPKDLTDSQIAVLQRLERLPEPTYMEMAAKAEPQNRAAAEKLAREITEAKQLATDIDGYRSTANFEYWRARTQVEPTDEALSARESIYLAGREYDKGNLLAAKRLYDRGWENWRKVIDSSERLRQDDITNDDMLEEVSKYFDVLRALDMDRDFPKGFVLQDLVEKFDKSGRWRKEPSAHTHTP